MKRAFKLACQLFERRVKLVDGIQDECRSATKLCGQFGGHQARDGDSLSPACNLAQVSVGRKALAVLGQAQAREVQPVTAQNLVQTLPGQEVGEFTGPSTDMLIGSSPGGVDELLREAWLQKFRQIIEDHAFHRIAYELIGVSAVRVAGSIRAIRICGQQAATVRGVAVRAVRSVTIRRVAV